MKNNKIAITYTTSILILTFFISAFLSNDTILNGINSIDVTEIGTYTTTPRSNGVVYGEGQGVITGKNNEIVTWSSQEIGIITPEKKIKFNGSIFFISLSS